MTGTGPRDAAGAPGAAGEPGPVDLEADRELLARLRHLWEEADPPPADLADAVLTVLEAQRIVQAEAALLELVLEQDGLVGVRGPTTTRTLQFADGLHEVLLRVTPEGTGTDEALRLDGWATPPRAGSVVVRSGGREHRAAVDGTGRFALVGVPRGPAVAWFEAAPAADPDPDAPARLGWRTPPFDL